MLGGRFDRGALMLRPWDTRSIVHELLAPCSFCLLSLPEIFKKMLMKESGADHVEIALWKGNGMFQQEGWVFMLVFV